MSSIDHLLQRLRNQREEGRRRDGEQQVARFLVTKLSWRGSYRRLMCITPTHVLTLYPDTLAVTNSWAYAGDHDLAGIEVGADHAEGGLVTFHFRRDKKGLGKDAKFACRERAGLLAALYRGIELAVARGSSGLGPTLLGPMEQFSCHKLRRGRWQPAVLRVTAHAVERLDPGTGLVKWRLEYRHMASPAARLLAPGEGQPAGQGAFALFGKTGRSPRVYCCSGREAVLKAIQAAALRKLGLTLAVDSNAALDGAQLLAAVAAAERERAATAADAPLGEWEVLKVRDLDAGDLAASRAAADVGGWSGVAQRRLVLTHKGLLERRPGDYEVAEWRQLAAVAALVRFSEDPQWLAVEWADGTPAATYVTPARDALLAALLDAAQTAAGRPIPVLCQPTAAGDPIVTQRGQALAAAAVVADPELEKLCLHQLNVAAKDFMSTGGGAASLAALALAGLTAASAAATAAEVGGGEGAPLLAGGSQGAASESGSDAAGGKASPRAADASGSSSSAGLFAAGRSGFMQRAFARQPVPHASGGSSSAGGGPGSEQAWAVFQRRVREFNSCVAYAGLTAGCKVDDVVIMALLAHLPRQQAAAGQLGLGLDEARLAIAALQCLQRLCGATVVASGRSGNAAVGMSQIIGAAGGAGRIFAALLSGHDHVAAEAARLLLCFFAPSAAQAGVGPWVGEAGAGSSAAPLGEPNEAEAAAAHAAKSVCFISQTRCAALVRVLRQSRGAPLLSMAVAEAMAAVLCEPGSRTTDQATLDALLQETAALGRPLFTLFSHPAPRVAHAAALLMRAVAEGGAEAAQPMREAALTEGAILQHLLSALSVRPGGHSELSRDLVALWADEYAPALALLKRIFPPGLIRYLNQRRQQPAAAAAAPPAAAPSAAPRAVAAQQPAAAGGAGQALPPPQQQHQQHAPQQERSGEGQQGSASALAATQQLVAAASAAPSLSPDSQQQHAQSVAQQQQPQLQQESATDGSAVDQRYMSPPPQRPDTLKGNWEAFWAAVGRDHAHAALVWNEGTRAELREALQAEEGALRLARLRAAGAEAGGGTLAWNHAEFRVAYPSLGKHLCIGGIFIRLLLEAPQAKAASAAAGPKSVVERLPAPKEFFVAAHHRLLCLGDASLVGAAGSLGGATSSGGGYGGTAPSSIGGASTGLRGDAEGDRELCVRAMAAAYNVHAGVIGPAEGIPHLVALLDATPSRALRQHLVLLLEALVAPSCLAASAGTATSAETADAGFPLPPPAGQEAAARAARANGVALLEVGGVQLMVDLVAAAHEASDRPVAALQTNLIAASSHAEEAREWFYWQPQAASGAAGGAAGTVGRAAGTAGQLQAGTEEGRVGPVSKAEIRQLYSSGAVTGPTYFWAAGMPEPLRLAAVRELRWWVAHRQGPLTAFEAAAGALRVLQALADQQPAVDSHGEVLFPLPLAHRLMASPACLPHLAQAVLTGEPALVSAACTLLLTVLRHNADGLSVLYRTGIQFFLLAYCGSNLREAARLLKACHLSSASAEAVAAAAAGRPLAQRSVLGGLLPESLLHMLESYGPDQFAAALVGDSDTPELIWTHRMRLERLVPQMLRHLGDFPRRLRECSHAVYEYTPCPPVGYPEIEGEVFCHRYYLKHLCDEQRHPGWPLDDHVQLLQSLLDAWRAELARQPLSMSEGDACQVLGITPQPDGSVPEEELKAAYRRLARLYHPDKNPAGRDKFVGIQAAYERLQAGAAGGQGPQPWRLLLLLRAQCVLFRRAADVLQPFKYAGYPLLLQAIALPKDGGQGPAGQHFLSAEAAPQLQAATELCWLTCACSRLNGDELARAGGLHLLARLLMRCIAVMPRDVHAADPAAVIATHALRALAVMAAFESTRAELAHSSQLVSDIVLCCGLQRAPAAVEAALVCLARCCASPQLQIMLLERGMLGYVVPLLLLYDATHEGGEDPKQTATATWPAAAAAAGAMPAADDAAAVLRLPLLRASAHATQNLQAQLAVRALAALAGYLPAAPPAADASKPAPASEAPPATEPCPAAQRALAALLTQTLAPRLAAPDPLPLLHDLNSTVQTPQVIWNNSMRQELLELLEQQRAAAASAAAAVATTDDGGGAAAALAATAPSDGFTYRCLQGELVLAGVFVRVYTEQPDFQLSDPASFCKALVTYIYQQQQVLAGAAGAAGKAAPNDSAPADRQRQQAHLLQALRALRLVLEAAPRLLGLLSTKPAVDPLLECLRPACTAGLAVQTPEGPWAPLPAGGGTDAPAALAAAPPTWAAGSAAAALPGASAAELEGAELALTVLLRLTAHAGCIDALSQDKCIAQAFWLAHRAPNAALLMLALRLLNALAGTAPCAWGAAAHGGTLFLLTLLLPAYQVPEEQRETFEAARVAAASLLSRLSAHPLHGARVALLLSKLLPPGLVSAVRDGPGEAAVAALAQSSETPERVWNRSMQRVAAEEVAHLAAVARAHQAATGALEWQPAEGFSLQFQELRGELLVGGVYVRLFLKDPRFPLRNPKLFIEGLLERYVAEVQRLTPAASQAPGSSLVGSPSKPASASALVPAKAAAAAAAIRGVADAAPEAARSAAGEGAAVNGAAAGGNLDMPLLLSAAVVAALQAQPGLAEHAVSLGYVEKLLRLLAARAPPLPPGGLTAELLDAEPLLPDEVSGSLLRLLHQLASCLAAAEALARCTPPAVPPLLGAMRWGTGAAVLALETLKRALAPANRWRDSLVAACLAAGLVTLLLQRLDWRHAAARRQQEQGQQEERDESVQRVLWVDLLNLLALEGASGERVRATLDASDVWAAYRGQRHDLFLPAGGTQAGGVAGLLTGPDAARFALPALMAPAATAAAESVVLAPPPAVAPQPVVAPQLASVAAPAVAAVPAPAPVPAPATAVAPAQPAVTEAVPPSAPVAQRESASPPAPAPVPAAVGQAAAPPAVKAPVLPPTVQPMPHAQQPESVAPKQQAQPPLQQQAQPSPALQAQQQAQKQAQQQPQRPPEQQQAQQQAQQQQAPQQPQQQAQQAQQQSQLDPLSAAAASAANELNAPPRPAAHQRPAAGHASPSAAARATSQGAAAHPSKAPLQPAASPWRQAVGSSSPAASPVRRQAHAAAAFTDPLSPGAAARGLNGSDEDEGRPLGVGRRTGGGATGSGTIAAARTSDSQDYGPLGPLG